MNFDKFYDQFSIKSYYYFFKNIIDFKILYYFNQIIIIACIFIIKTDWL